MASDIGTAYIQILPSTKGIQGSISKVLSGEAASAGDSAGSSIGGNLVGKLKGIIAAAGLGVALKKALDAGGALQQSLGGIDTLYTSAEGGKEAVKVLEDYAEKASSAGIAANTYAEQATAFGASLKAAYGGDVKKAAEAANTAIMDMADNSAKMGTDIGSVQAAYQGFAKQNYTMLDNLKLGYGGTKGEMQRLLKDAEKLSGVKYNIDNLGDVYSAIHVIQKDLNLTGVAAKEAKTTFTGSFGAMQAAAENLMADLTLGRDIGPAISQLATSAGDFFFGNLVPMLGRLIITLPSAIGQFIQAAVPAFAEQGMALLDGIDSGFMNEIPKFLETAATGLSNLLDRITEKLPGFLDKGSEMITNMANGFLAALPGMIQTLGDMLVKLIDFWGENYPVILQKGWETIKNLADGFLTALPDILASLGTVAGRAITALLSHLPEFLKVGGQMLLDVAVGIVTHIPDVIKAIAKMGNNIIKEITGIDLIKSGKDLIDNFLKGVTSGFDKVGKTFKKMGGIIKDFIGFSEPDKGPLSNFHTFAPDMMDLFVLGINQNIPQLQNAVDDIASTVKSGIENPINAKVNSAVSGSIDLNNSNSSPANFLDPLAFYEAVERGIENADIKVSLNNREVSRSLKDMGVQFA